MEWAATSILVRSFTEIAADRIDPEKILLVTELLRPRNLHELGSFEASGHHAGPCKRRTQTQLGVIGSGNIGKSIGTWAALNYLAVDKRAGGKPNHLMATMGNDHRIVGRSISELEPASALRSPDPLETPIDSWACLPLILKTKKTCFCLFSTRPMSRKEFDREITEQNESLKGTLLSRSSLVSGGAQLPTRSVVILGPANLLADGFSMAAGVRHTSSD